MDDSEPEPTSPPDQDLSRHLRPSSLLEFVTPPPGYVLDRAVCSAYSAQCAVLMAMLVAMLRQGPYDGLDATSLALARALQRLEGRVHFLLQNGRLTGPRNTTYRILNMLDRFVVYQRYNEQIESWHPKACVLRFLPADSKSSQGAIWRLWIGSRNFTRDQSWDMALSLTGQANGKGEKLAETVEFTRRLALAANAHDLWKTALKELPNVRWQVPAGLRVERLALFVREDKGRDMVAAPAESRRILAVSPFLDGWAVGQLLKDLPQKAPKGAQKPRLVSTEGCFAELARNHRQTLGPYKLLSLPASDQDSKETVEEAAEGDAAEPLEARGLHAKFAWIETPGRGELRLGSTNLTKRGWQKNAEALAVVSVVLPGGSFAQELQGGMAAFENLGLPYTLPPVDAQPDEAQELLEEFEEIRKSVVHHLAVTQTWRDQEAVVKVQAMPQLDPRATLRIGRIGGVLLPCPADSTELVLAPAPLFENGDFLQVELSMGDAHCSAWLHHAPFVPALTRAQRDVPLLHAYLGIEGVLALLNDSLTGGGNSGGDRRRWDDTTPIRFSGASMALLGIEAVLGSWMRNEESLQETLRIVDIARQCKPGTEAEQKVFAQLRDFLLSWDAVEQELVKR